MNNKQIRKLIYDSLDVQFEKLRKVNEKIGKLETEIEDMNLDELVEFSYTKMKSIEAKREIIKEKEEIIKKKEIKKKRNEWSPIRVKIFNELNQNPDLTIKELFERHPNLSLSSISNYHSKWINKKYKIFKNKLNEVDINE